MNVQQLIDELMKISDKSKQVVMVWNSGTDFDEEPFIEQGIVEKVSESENMVELIDNMNPKY
ncbi:hypothetical protein GKS17_08145 [Streptococcus uberis]|uniref:hypothetical protein n=1 Tax=Streptococcus uberis TaxID=1349 RepID=UPI0012B52359|nr:hypothetical protein [Streptococcus uberis]MTC89827.1 hypothetical protein [Streptococcus uberis]MTC96757.1 hypothetical protein [Streptococcus uberis]